MIPITEVAVQLQSQLIDTISRRLGTSERNKIAAMSTFLDPRFKKTSFGVEENANNVEKWSCDEIIAMVSPSCIVEKIQMKLI